MKLETSSTLSVVNKHSSRTLGISAVFFSCLGGIELGRGIEEFIFNKGGFTWVTSFLFGPAFLAYGIFWIVMLVRRTRSSTP